MITIYNQIHTLLDSRSYSGSELFSDHKIVVTRLRSEWFILCKQKVYSIQKNEQYNTESLIKNSEIRKKYQQNISYNIENLENRSWENITKVIKEAAEKEFGKKSLSKNPGKTKELRKSRNKTIKEIKSSLKDEREKQIDKVVENIEKSTHNDNMMFKAVKDLQKGKRENLFVHNNKGKRVIEESKIIEIVSQHFHEHFYDETVPSIEAFEGNPRPHVTGEMIKYGPIILHKVISDSLNNIFETHNLEINIGKSILKPLQKNK